MIIAQIDSNELTILLVQKALSDGSELSSTAMIGLAFFLLLALLLVIFVAILIHNAIRVRDEKASPETIGRVMKALALAMVFIIISILLIGVFYVF